MWLSNFQKGSFETVTITVTEIILIQVFSQTVGSRQKNKNDNIEYHDTFRPFKSQLYSKLGNLFLSCFGHGILYYIFMFG